MFIFPYLHILSFFLQICLAVYILSKNTKSILNRLCAFFITIVGLWNLGMVGINNPDASLVTAKVFHNISVLSWGTLPSFYFWFLIVFTEEERWSKRKWFFPSIFIPAFINVYVQWTRNMFFGYTKMSFGWSFQWKSSAGVHFFFVYYSLFYIMCILLLFMFWKQTGNARKKTQAVILLLVSAITGLSGAITNIALPQIRIFTPDLGAFTSIIFSVGVVYAMAKYQFLTVSSATAAENIVANMADGLFLLDPDGRIETINIAASTMLGYSPGELHGSVVGVLFKREEKSNRHIIEAIMTRMSLRNSRGVLVSKDGKHMPVLFSTSVLIGKASTMRGTVCVVRDISNREKMERELTRGYVELKYAQERLIQSEKLAGIGQLAAGVAHEINNPTGFIVSNMQTGRQYVNKFFSLFSKIEQAVEDCGDIIGEEQKVHLKDSLQKIYKEYDIDYIRGDILHLIAETEEGAHRIKQIVSDLRDYANPDAQRFVDTDINKEIEKVLLLVHNELKYKCTVSKSLAAIPHIYANCRQIDQVFVNLLINAAQAIENKGTISIKTYESEGFVCIEFTDTGKGISQEDIDKIFEPFFTTKDVGVGTGLGLAIVNGIISNHGGKIYVESMVNRGTTFTIKLPISSVEA